MEKCQFWVVEKLLFYCHKKFLFYLEHPKLYFWSYFDRKEKMEKIAFFLPKVWVNPFGKVRFWGRWKMLFLVSKVFFLSRTLLNLMSNLILTENKNWKKVHFFYQKHGLTPLEKYNLWDFEKFCLYLEHY